MPYEMFKGKAVRVTTPALSITPGGRVAFNAPACRLLLEARTKTVMILWDEAQNRMAVQAAPKGETNSFTVTFTGRNSATFAAKAFLRHIGWNATKRELLPTTWNAGEKMFEACLPAKHVAGTGKRGAKAT